MDNVWKKAKQCEIINSPEKARDYISLEEYNTKISQSQTIEYKYKIVLECCWQLLREIHDLEFVLNKQNDNITQNIMISKDSFNSITTSFAEVDSMLKSVVEALKPFANCITEEGQMTDIIHLSREDFIKAAKAIEAVNIVKGWTKKINVVKEEQEA